MVRWPDFRKTLSFKSLLDGSNLHVFGPNNYGALKYDTPEEPSPTKHLISNRFFWG